MSPSTEISVSLSTSSIYLIQTTPQSILCGSNKAIPHSLWSTDSAAIDWNASKLISEGNLFR